MTKTTELWVGEPIHLPDEHRIFRAIDGILLNRNYTPNGMRSVRGVEEHGAWAIADNSGHTPETTDDGIWWLDFSKNIMISKDGTGNPCIPIVNPQGTPSVFITNIAGLLILSDMFRWTMNVGGKLYRTIRW